MPPLRFFIRSLRRFALRAACLAVLLQLTGCQMYRALGSGQRIDNSTTRKHREPSARKENIQVEVTTDGAGAVSDIRIVRSSGSPGVDGYVVETIRTGWPGQPSTKALVEVSYAPATGFTQPKLISSKPAP